MQPPPKGPQPISAVVDDVVGALDRMAARRRAHYEKRAATSAQPGETLEQTIARLRKEDDDAIAREDEIRLRATGTSTQSEGDRAAPNKPKSSTRKPPRNDIQPDFFVPGLYDVGGRDNRSIMDVAVFRLSKKDKRAGDMIRYDLPDGYVEVKSNMDGMASIWDYDIVLMMISHLTEAVNRWRSGKGGKPGRTYQPHVSDILKFCRRGDGGKQIAEIEAALDRLKGTTIKVVRDRMVNGRPVRETNAEGLISGYSVLARTDTKRLSAVEVEVPRWLYREVVEGKDPNVLTVDRDYFLIEQGIGKFLYRLARQAAGKPPTGPGRAEWLFKTLYERSSSTGTFKKFSFTLRQLIQLNDLPEYSLAEKEGVGGQLLVMTYRGAPTGS